MRATQARDGVARGRCPGVTLGEFLVLRAREPERARSLYEAIRDEHCGALRSDLRRHDIAEDAIQDAAVALFAPDAAIVHRDALAVPISDWHWGVLRALVHCRLVRRSRRREAFEGWARHGRPVPEPREPDEDAPHPPICSEDAWARVFLPVAPAHRLCAELRLRHRLSYREIALRLGVSSRTARRRSRAALTAIRRDVLEG